MLFFLTRFYPAGVNFCLWYFYCCCKVCLHLFNRSPVWYPDTPRHYTIPSSFARHYFLESDRTIHGRQRAFQVTETETGILQVIYLKSNWVLFVLYFQYSSHASCLRKEGHNRTELFFFFFFCISPVYTNGFCCSNSIQFLSCSSCSLKKARIKVFKISM